MINTASSGLSSPFTLAHQQPQEEQPAAFGAVSHSNAFNSASSMNIHIPSHPAPSTPFKSATRKRSRDDLDEDDAMINDDVSRPTLSNHHKLSTPRSAIGNPTLAQWVELDPHTNHTTLASLGLLPSANGGVNGNANLFSTTTPSTASSFSFHQGASYTATSAGTPAMTGSPSSFFSEVTGGMPPTPSDSHSMLPHQQAQHQRQGPNAAGYFGSSHEKQSQFAGILEPQLGLTGADVSMDDGVNGSGEQKPSSHGPWCKSIPQLSVRADGTGSELWALCRDCGAFDKVNPTPLQTVNMAYSP
ncbi:hypothetical protein OC846_003392 [Tilletia horrida]|uniref:Uncharacterized protein n=1 Tax=Tilletia horrida TaxID=155126 RepID=A0AAN6JY03_9BASI|nr:hypothetical protein OC845_003217 [Tilletia horrida]KAK0551152.1 hypothetical protein OC846_003392 [Tilletia horrida]KAK0566115.1 hypothetical protein OC861_003409 [Tilletia horrida]